jgi:spermidine synthase
VELSQGAIEAAQDWFVPVNDDALRHMRVTRDDARRFLRTDTQYYDVIIGDLFHPDLAGQSALLSVQQFSRARARLTDNGLFVQWLALNQFDAQSLAVVLRTFRHVFPDAVIFVEGFRLALVGPRGAFQGAPGLLANIAALPAGASNAVTGGEGIWTWLGRYWGKIPASPGPLQEEWAPRIEFSLPGARYRGEMDLAKLLAELLNHRPALAQAAEELQVAAQDRVFFERAYIATELALRGWLATLQGQEESAALLRLAYEANPHDRWISFSVADGMLATLPQAIGQGMDKREALLTVLKIRPDHAVVLRALWDLERAAGNNAEAQQYRMRLQAVSPLDTALRTTH